MTQKQIDAVKSALHKKYYGNDCVKPGVNWEAQDKVTNEEMSCREMINSIMIYGGSCAKDTHDYEKYLLPYTKKGTWHDGLITLARLDELIKEQKADIEKAQIGFAGYDSEGVSYNYCKFADEQ